MPGAKGARSRAAVAAGRGHRGYLLEMLFLCILKQKLDWPDSLAVGEDRDGTNGGRAGGGGGSRGTVRRSVEQSKPSKRRRT